METEGIQHAVGGRPVGRAARRRAGILQDFANQLAQMAVGFEIVFDADRLASEPPVGVIEIDVKRAMATVNGSARDLHLPGKLRKWSSDELDRKHLPESWLISAIVTIRYFHDSTPSVSAVARVESAWGDGAGSSHNSYRLHPSK